MKSQLFRSPLRFSRGSGSFTIVSRESVFSYLCQGSTRHINPDERGPAIRPGPCRVGRACCPAVPAPGPDPQSRPATAAERSRAAHAEGLRSRCAPARPGQCQSPQRLGSPHVEQLTPSSRRGIGGCAIRHHQLGDCGVEPARRPAASGDHPGSRGPSVAPPHHKHGCTVSFQQIWGESQAGRARLRAGPSLRDPPAGGIRRSPNSFQATERLSLPGSLAGPAPASASFTAASTSSSRSCSSIGLPSTAPPSPSPTWRGAAPGDGRCPVHASAPCPGLC